MKAAGKSASNLVTLTRAEKKLFGLIAGKIYALRTAEETKKMEKAFRQQVVHKRVEKLQLGNRLDEHREEEQRRREREKKRLQAEAQNGPQFSVATAVVQSSSSSSTTPPLLLPDAAQAPPLPPPPQVHASQARQRLQKLMEDAIDEDRGALAAAALTQRDREREMDAPTAALPPPPPPPRGAELIKKRQLRDEDEDDKDAASAALAAMPLGRDAPEPDQVSTAVWNSRREPRNQSYALRGFSLHGKNTITAKLSIPHDASWSLNVSPADDFYHSDVLFHFNPRNGQRALVLNDRQGTWGDYLRKRVDGKDLLVRDVTLRVHITEEGFYVFADNRFRVFFAHRRAIRAYEEQDLQLWFTHCDNNGLPHSVTVRRVLWQHSDCDEFDRALASSTREEVLRVLTEPPPRSVKEPMPPRTVLLSGVPALEDLKVIFAIELNLFRAFDGLVEAMSFLPGTTFAFARLKDESKVAGFIEDFDELVVQSRDGAHTIRMRPMAAPAAPPASTTPTMAWPAAADDEEPSMKRSKYDVDEDEVAERERERRRAVNVVEDESHTPLLPPPAECVGAVSPSTTPVLPLPPAEGEGEEEEEEESEEESDGEYEGLF